MSYWMPKAKRGYAQGITHAFGDQWWLAETDGFRALLLPNDGITREKGIDFSRPNLLSQKCAVAIKSNNLALDLNWRPFYEGLSVYAVMLFPMFRSKPEREPES